MLLIFWDCVWYTHIVMSSHMQAAFKVNLILVKTTALHSFSISLKCFKVFVLHGC